MFQIICVYVWLQLACRAASHKHAHSKSSFITLEEHYVPLVLRQYETDYQVERLNAQVQGRLLPNKLGDVSARLIEMGDNGIEMQILSINPNPYVLDRPDLVSAANKELHDITSSFPERFKGLCMLPMAIPRRAADELEKCVVEYGFVGALVDNHLANGTYYDGKQYDVFWSTSVRLGVPIYLHPTFPSSKLADLTNRDYFPSQDSYTLNSAAVLSTAGWGWHSDTGLHFLRLWLGGVFDRHPHLKIIMGHMGEMLPYMLGRVNSTLGKTRFDGVSVYTAYKNNLWITTSGFFDIAPFMTLRNVTAIERILFSIDYPYASMNQGVEFMARLRESQLVNDREWDGIACGNARTLFNLV